MTRILLKISGEALKGSESSGVDAAALNNVALKLRELQASGVEVAVVLGGGNLFRGLSGSSLLKLERSPADQVGMLATIMNGILLEQALRRMDLNPSILSAIDCPQIVERFHWEKARQKLESGHLLILVGGTGHPYFTTDTAAALRASEIGADELWKGTTRVDGIYDKDPLKHKDAKRYDRLSYEEYLEKKLGILDLTAVTLCMTNRIPIRVFNFNEGSLVDGSLGSKVG